MGSASNLAVVRTIRSRLLTFQPRGGGATAAARLGTLTGAGADGKLYLDGVPDSTTYPYSTMSIDWDATDGYSGYRLGGMLELMTYHKPRAQLAIISPIADCYDEALLEWVETSGGFFGSRLLSRRTLPPFPEPADRELVVIRQVFSVAVWPEYLTQYAIT
jgi:hypothetical protein